ncbi:MAG: aminotransferase class V-fold PLP-dependent enzyme [Clostridiaceae bacterium]|jgi:cysteine desulfurase/selenocysteine lyase|nr:aminotransferase class V-fold PLP-dependent enzyme [Clostridiaceae bacterium]
MIYLDNAATSFPKPKIVYEEIMRCMKEYCANPGRSGHKMSLRSAMMVQEARETISKFFNINNPMQIAFTKNATEALNIAIHGVAKEGCHIITTSMEHNSVLRPLKKLRKSRRAEISIVQGNEIGEIDPVSIGKLIKSNTCLIISTLSSNVNGTIMPVGEIGKLAGEHNIPFLLDASQGAGSINIDVEKMNISLMAFPGHKGLLGPQGTGGLYIKEGMLVKPLLQGGTGSFSNNLDQPDLMPDLHESGTLNLPGIVGLKAGIEFINSLGIENIRIYKNMLLTRLYEGIKGIKEVKIYSTSNAFRNSGILALNISDYDSMEIAEILDDKYNIAVRGSYHCAFLAHKTLGTEKQGLVRFSLGCFNTIEDIDYTIKALQEISRLISR